MRQVTHWVESESEINFAIDQLKVYGIEPIIMYQVRDGQKTGLLALFREDMKGEPEKEPSIRKSNQPLTVSQPEGV